MTDTLNSPESTSNTLELPHSRAIITWTVAALCVVFTALYHMGGYLRGTPLESLPRYLVQPPQAIWSGNWSTLFTSVFVHATAGNGIPWHLIFNMLYFVLLGRIMEATLNPLYWLLFFVTSAVVSAGAELAFSSRNAIGASGVVYAMFGLMWAGRYEKPIWAMVATPKTFKILIGWGVLCVVTTYFGILNVANFAHAAGLLFGMGAGWLLIAHRRLVPAATILVFLAVTTILSITWMPWSGEWNLWKGNQFAEERKFDRAAAYYQASLKHGEDPLVVLPRLASVEDLRLNKAAAQSAINEYVRLLMERRSSPQNSRSTRPL
jgi:membrane associated rhomboid family serine protease